MFLSSRKDKIVNYSENTIKLLMINEFILDYWYIMLVVCGLYEGLYDMCQFFGFIAS